MSSSNETYIDCDTTYVTLLEVYLYHISCLCLRYVPEAFKFYMLRKQSIINQVLINDMHN